MENFERRPHDNSRPTGSMPRQPGTPGLNRNARRISNFNSKRAEGNWADEAYAEERTEEVRKRNLQKLKNREYAEKRLERKANRDASLRKQPTLAMPVDSEKQKGVTITPPRNELMWDDGPFSGTTPVIQQYSHNIDLSTLPDIIDATYRTYENIDPKVGREMPFCNYQHAMGEVVNVYLINKLKKENKDVEFADEEDPIDILPNDMKIPALMGEFLQSISQTVTPNGDTLYINVPEAIRPQGPENGIEAGSFGVCTAEDHNKYEVAMSPLVTKALVERTLLVNRNPEMEGAFDNWNPLPAQLQPPNSVATPNLLGYRIPEKLEPEGVRKCENLTFAEGNTIAGRIRDCPEIMISVADYIKSKENKIKTTLAIPPSLSSNTVLGIVVTDKDVPSTRKLTHESVQVESPVALSVGSSNKTGAFGLKRRRTARAPGCCFVSRTGENLPGWVDTINAHYNMENNFRPKIGIDNRFLRRALHNTANSGGSRYLRLYEYAKRYTIS